MSEPLLLKRRLSYWPAIAIWAGFAALMVALDGVWSLGNQALLLVLCSTLASFWLSASASVVVSAVAVAGFNWFAVPPRFTFHVELHQDLLLLVTLLCTSSVISVLTARLRSHAQAQVLAAEQARQQQTLATGLQKAGTVAEQVRLAQTLISAWAGRAVALLLLRPGPDEAWFWPEGEAQALPDLQPLLTACVQEQNAIGPGTGRYDSLPALVLPLRAGVRVIGALALAPWAADPDEAPLSLALLQNLARLLADEIERLEARQQAQQAHEHLQSQQLRNTLLAAISHDYRTPLATITGAASSLLQQAGEVHAPRAQQQAQTILAEAGHLHRMTTHTLQLARLDGTGTPLQCSWESLEELWGVVLASARRRWPERAFQADVPPGLPLLWCEPILLVQLFENLVDNAVHYSPTDAPVQLQAQQLEDAIEMAVLDRGPGIPAEWREKVFDPFSRMQSAERPDPNQDALARRGMGLGLALCQAVAKAHEARLWIDAREGGGTAVRLRLPLLSQPLAQTEALAP
jgi:two-component system sensor histidine kinase KdpD